MAQRIQGTLPQLQIITREENLGSMGIILCSAVTRHLLHPAWSCWSVYNYKRLISPNSR